MTDDRVRVVILMGSISDWPVMKGARETLDGMGIGTEVRVLSAHRTPADVAALAGGAAERGVGVLIAGAGGAAHLAGVVAAHTTLPVIGVPVSNGPLKGMDSLLATVQMPPGIPVATVGIDRASNAGLLAAQILALADERIADELSAQRQAMRTKVRAADDELQKELSSIVDG